MKEKCGSVLPPNITSLTNIVHIDFHTDSDTTRTGWKITWSAVKPGPQEKVFLSLIDSYREQWNNDNLPFYYVQLAPFADVAAKIRSNSDLTRYCKPPFPSISFWSKL